MTGATSSPKSTVLIAIGPEWAPIKRLVQDWLSEHVLTAPTAIALLDADASKPAGRVARWIVSEGGAEILVPSGDQDSGRSGIWCGVTELLLDPDPAQAEQLYSLGIWTRFANRTDRFRMRFSPDLPMDIVDQAMRFSPDLSVLVGEWQGQRVIMAGRDMIASEVTARAFRALAQPAGDVGLSPWQAPLVQAAIERGMGATGGHHMRLDLRLGNPIDPQATSDTHVLAGRICHVLDTQAI